MRGSEQGVPRPCREHASGKIGPVSMVFKKRCVASFAGNVERGRGAVVWKTGQFRRQQDKLAKELRGIMGFRLHPSKDDDFGFSTTTTTGTGLL